MIRTTTSAVLVATIAAVLSMSSAMAQSAAGLAHSQARITRAAAGVPLTAASKAAPQSVVAGYLQSRSRSADVLASLRVSGSSTSDRGVTHVRFEQQVDGLAVYGAYAKAAINGNGELVHMIDGLADVSLVAPSRIDAGQALNAALAKLYPGEAGQARAASARGNTTVFAGSAFFHRNPAVTAVVLPLDNGTLARGWVVETWTAAKNQLHYTVVSGDGQVLEVESRTNNDRYNVFTDSPEHGNQTVTNGPGAGNAQSPSGWLSGAQTTNYIRGNNVNAYLDTDANNSPDAGGTAVTNGDFLSAIDLGSSPGTATNKSGATQNLFFLNNFIHDVLYSHGFNEAAGNFQVNNFGKGGSGNDPVSAEAQDGSGTDNANMSTPADGSSPRMQMYLWSPALPAEEAVVAGTSYGVRQSAFGTAITATGITFPLASSASDGCTAYTAGTFTNKIAIISRGTCNFTVKVLNAQNAGAKGVLLQNNVAGNDSFAPGGTDRKVKIPSGMVGNSDGAALRALAGQSANLRKKAVAPPQLDGDLDSDIVYHEYGHGLTWRMIGGMSGPLAGAIGEGASDVVAFLVNGRPVMGTYAFASSAGIRRFSYEGYPNTYADVGNEGLEVHNDGEIYAGAMWKVRANYLAANLSVQDLFGDFVDGMNYTPATPAFEDMRDGMLAAVGSDVTRQCAIWKGFASSGIGVGADGTVSRRGAVTIVESTTVPAICQ